jgi:hypothetical protein
MVMSSEVVKTIIENLARNLGLEQDGLGTKWWLQGHDWDGLRWLVQVATSDGGLHEVFLSQESWAELWHHYEATDHKCEDCGRVLGEKEQNPWGHVRSYKRDLDTACECAPKEET